MCHRDFPWNSSPARRAFVAGTAAALAVPLRRPRAQAKPIRIGVLTDMTGLYADSLGPGSVLAAQMAAAEAGGAILGRPVEIISADNQNKADIGSTIARRWYDEEGVSLVVGRDNSAVAVVHLEPHGRDPRLVATLLRPPPGDAVDGPRRDLFRRAALHPRCCGGRQR